MKKNFLIYVEDPRFGGPHQFTLNILDHLRLNFNVSILFSNIENKIFLKKIKSKKIKYNTLPISFLSLELLHIFRYIFYFFYEVYKLRNFLKKSDPGRIRTLNPQSRNLIFYPVELRSHFEQK